MSEKAIQSYLNKRGYRHAPSSHAGTSTASTTNNETMNPNIANPVSGTSGTSDVAAAAMQGIRPMDWKGAANSGPTPPAASSATHVNTAASTHLNSNTHEQTATRIENKLFDLTNEQESQVSSGYYTMLSAAHKSDPKSTPNPQSNLMIEYANIRQWVHDSLDTYKKELSFVLYPLFVHFYLELILINPNLAKSFFEKYTPDFKLDHAEELEKLEVIKDPIHVKESSIAMMFRQNKYQLRWSVYSFELFMTFLSENRWMATMKVMNQYLHVLLIEGKRNKATEEWVAGFGDASLSSPLSLAIPYNNETDPGTSQALALHLLSFCQLVWKQLKADWSLSMKPERIEELIHELQSILYTSSTAVEPNATIPLPVIDMELELNKLKELSKRINAESLFSLTPLKSSLSTCCYTVQNSYERVSCVSFSRNDIGRWMAVGSLDSWIQIYRLDGQTIPIMKSSVSLALIDYDTVPEWPDLFQGEPPMSPSPTQKSITDHNEIRKPSCMIELIGHAGPVYGTAFVGPLDRALLSWSADATIRLWSLDMRKCLSIYKGHEGPIWALDIHPKGYWFISGGWDRVIRVWSTDHASPHRLLVGHLSDISHVAYHPNGLYCISGSLDASLRLWDIMSGSTVRLFRQQASPGLSVSLHLFCAVTWTLDGKHIIVASKASQLVLYDVATGKSILSVSNPVVASIVRFAWPFAIKDNTTALCFVSIGHDGQLCHWIYVPPSYTSTPSLNSTNHTSSTTAGNTSSSILNESSSYQGTTPNLILVDSFKTKNTPLMDATFTFRNLLLVAGPQQ